MRVRTAAFSNIHCLDSRQHSYSMSDWRIVKTIDVRASNANYFLRPSVSGNKYIGLFCLFTKPIGIHMKCIPLPAEVSSYFSLVVRKPAFCICENKDADRLRGNREADLRLCFRYIDNTTPLLPKSRISSLWPSSLAVQPGLCRTWSETPKTGFLTTRLILFLYPFLPT